jgi:TonB family protein
MSEICERVREEAVLLGRAPETEDLKEHAATCPECSEFLSKLATLGSDLAALRSRDATDELVAKVLAMPELNRRPSFRWRVWAMATASAASVVLAAVLTIRTDSKTEREFNYVANLEGRQTGGSSGAGDVSPRRKEGFEQDVRDPNQPDAAPPSKEQVDSLRSLGYTEGDEVSVETGVLSSEDKLERVDELRRQEEELGKKDSPAAGGRVGGLLLDEKALPAKRAHHDPVYPDAAKNAGVQGTVVLELTVNRAGDVVAVRVVSSVPLLDAAAVEAVREWKYAPSDSDTPRVFRVSVPFTLEEPGEDEDRSRVDGLAFQEAKGYWANTYLPGDPILRSLEHRLRGEAYPQIHQGALPASLPYDATSTGALSLFLHADRKGVTEKTRLLVQVGIRASDRHGRRRPPMNVGVVLDLPQPVPQEVASAATALLESLESSLELGDRFRLIATGAGELLAPEDFRRGPLTVALQDLYGRTPSGNLSDSLALALEKVHAGDDPTQPLGTSLVLLVSARELGSEIETLSRLAQTSALGGVSLSVVGVGANLDAEAERLALDGQGRRYDLDLPSEAPSIIDRELTSASRTVARAIRLRIHLAEGVHLVGVLGSERLGARESERVRAEERAIDLRLARNLGIDADRGKDEDGIQIVIPAFYAGDAHSILLDVVAEGPGPIAEVTARYKDLVRLENTVSRASLALGRSDAASGPLEVGVESDYRELRVARALLAASEAVGRGETGTASQTLLRATIFAPERDRLLLEEYLRFFPQLPTEYLRDSLLYASALKRSHS